MEQYDHQVDAFIDKSAPFAKPILQAIRQIVHEVSPQITETIKWGMPFFDYKGPVCFMAAFKQHCGFGFWKASLLNDPQKILINEEGGAGNVGRLVSVDDLPSKEVIVDFIKQAMARNDAGIKPPKKAPEPRAELLIPDYFANALANHTETAIKFEMFTYSQKKEYVEWLEEAKTEATRQKRLQTAIEWIAEAKTRNWKYK